uniref:DNA starvation/stationary phase protection protein n=1 Tax=Thermosporothrix sp. COM3 TaxID=2490863 RepID=A0A455SKU8_9CHLR|nr:DNA starvation/stationary phase protection protein [Thermosporothrix sp. COM3]
MVTRTRNVEAQPKLHQRSYEIQQFGQLHAVPLGLPENAIKENVELLNKLVLDSIMLYNMYKKHHWHMAGPTFYQLHLLLDKHAEQILETIDLMAERVQMLGGVAAGMPHDVVENTRIERPPKGEEAVPAMIARLVDAHATIIKALREAIETTEKNKDYGTNDLLVSDVLRMHEMQVWFLSQHLVDTPLIGEETNK